MTPAHALESLREPGPSPLRAAKRLPVAAISMALALTMALAGCQPTPQPSPPTSPGSPAPVATGGDLPPASLGSPDEEPELAAELRDGLDLAAVLDDLQRLQDIATSNEGHRAAGSASEAEAARYVADELREAGFAVELQKVAVPWFSQDAPSVLEVDGAASQPEDLRDFKAMLLSPSGDVRGPLHALEFDPAASPGDRSGIGCDPADFNGVRRGDIVLVRPGPCLRRDIVVNAQAAGAVAIITAFPEWQRDMVLRPTLIDSSGLGIPALATSNDMGITLAQAAGRGASARVVVVSTIQERTGINVTAESAGGSDDHVLYLGGHFDSSVDGPGINDNGSGTMAILEIARRLAGAATGPQSDVRNGWKLRIGFWTGEEIALLGSSAFVGSLDAAAIAAAEGYLNFDMLGSPNGVREIYGAQTTRPTESQAIAALFSSAFERAGLTSTVIELGGASDHVPFNNVSIPVGGLFSGANEPKTLEQAELFGGTAGAPNDPCYHLACDTFENIDPLGLEAMARAAAWVVGALASGEMTLRPS